jgi:hypothetical protein
VKFSHLCCNHNNRNILFCSDLVCQKVVVVYNQKGCLELPIWKYGAEFLIVTLYLRQQLKSINNVNWAIERPKKIANGHFGQTCIEKQQSSGPG